MDYLYLDDLYKDEKNIYRNNKTKRLDKKSSLTKRIWFYIFF